MIATFFNALGLTRDRKSDFPEEHDLRLIRMTSADQLYPPNEIHGKQISNAEVKRNERIFIYESKNGGLGTKSNQEFINAAKSQSNIRVEAIESDEGKAQIILISKKDTSPLFNFLESFDQHNDDVERRKNPPPPPLEKPQHLIWPGAKSTSVEQIQYLIDVRDYVRSLGNQEERKYRQRVHSDAPGIGDPRVPAILDASYPHFDSKLVSISLPDFLPFEAPSRHSIFNEAATNEFSSRNIAQAFDTLRTTFQVPDNDDITKIGHDKASRTVYLETRVTHDSYERGRMIIDALTRSEISNAEDFITHIAKGDRIREALNSSGSRIDFKADGSITVDLPDDYALSELNAFGIDPDNRSTQSPSDENDVRPGYKRTSFAASELPTEWQTPSYSQISIDVNNDESTQATIKTTTQSAHNA